LIEINTEVTALLWQYWYYYECDERAEKNCTQWFPGVFTNVSNIFIVFGRRI
jgi:hypothetical protein